MGRGSLYAVCLSLLLAGGAILVGPSAQADPHHLQVENAVLVCNLGVDFNNWRAQSFVPGASFTLTRVSLFIEDLGDESLNVTVRPDVGGQPDLTILSAASVNGPPSPEWVDFDVAPRVGLLANVTYWIVAHPEAAAGPGYDWWDSGNDSAYAPGTGMGSVDDGLTWTPEGLDLSFRVYGFPQPIWEFAVGSSSATAMPGDAVVFGVNFTNLGPGSSAGLWINVTLPPELTYVSDDAATIGGSRTGAHNYTFGNVTSGAFSFNLTTSVGGGGLPDGTVVLADFAFEGADHLGAPLSQETLAVPLTILTGVAYAFDAQALTAPGLPGENVSFWVSYAQQGPRNSTGLWINVTLPPELTYVSDDAASIGGNRTGAHNYTFADVAPGSYAFNFTASVDGVVSNGTVVVTDFRFEGADSLGFPMTQETRSVPITIVTDLSFSFGITPSAPSLAPGDNVAFRVDIANLGPATSAGLWLNVTLPPELAFVGDDAAAMGGARTGAHNYTFGVLPPASYGFNFTASAVGGVPNGTQAVVEFLFTGRDSAGAPMIPEQREATATFRNPVLALSLTPNGASFDPGDAVVVTATITNTGPETARSLRARAAVDANLTYESSPSGTYDPGTRTVQWNLPSLGPGAQTVLTWTGRVKAGTPDLASLRFPASVAYQDPSGTALPSVEATNVSGVRAPIITPLLQLSRGSAGRGDPVVATLLYTNTGTGTAGRAWANWTLGNDFALVGLSPAVSPTLTAAGFSVAFPDVTPGVHALKAELAVTRGMEDGLALGLEVRWTAYDINGNPLRPATLNGTVRLDAPAVGLVLEPATGRVDRGSSFGLNLTIQNTGQGPAAGILELALPSGVRFLGDNGTFPVTASANRVLWNITTVAAATILSLGIQLQAIGDPGPRSLRFVFNYHDGRGSPAVGAFSNAVAVELVALGGTQGLPWWWWVPIVAAAVPAAYFWLRRRRAVPLRIHEVFVVERGGLVLAHQSDTLIEEKDEDIVAAAFTAVQEFVRHHFSKDTDEGIRTLEVGDRKILLEHGGSHYVAVVFSGEEGPFLRTRVRDLSEEIDRTYGYILSDWQGDSEAIRGISELLPRLFGP